MFGEKSDNFVICRGECRFVPGRDGFGMDGVGIVVVEYEDIFISFAGWADKFPV